MYIHMRIPKYICIYAYMYVRIRLRVVCVCCVVYVRFIADILQFKGRHPTITHRVGICKHISRAVCAGGTSDHPI